MRLLQQNSRAADLLCAEDVEELWHDGVHQLEVRGQRRGVLVLIVQALLAELLRRDRRAGPAVDEDELLGE
jgi:hypothetical protein